MNELAYSFSLTTFSPSGHLRQITYALAAADGGRLSIGIKCANGVVLMCHKAAENPLIDYSTISLVDNVSPCLGITYSGFSADFRNLLNLGRKSYEQYWNEFQEPMPVNMIARDIASTMQEYTQRGGVRPFGCSVLLAGKSMAAEHETEVNGKRTNPYILYQVDSSGSYYTWKACANGNQSSQARDFLEKRYNETVSISDGILIGLTCLHEYVDGDIDGKTVEIGIVGDETGGQFRQLTADEINTYAKQIK